MAEKGSRVFLRRPVDKADRRLLGDQFKKMVLQKEHRFWFFLYFSEGNFVDGGDVYYRARILNFSSFE